MIFLIGLYIVNLKTKTTENKDYGVIDNDTEFDTFYDKDYTYTDNGFWMELSWDSLLISYCSGMISLQVWGVVTLVMGKTMPQTIPNSLQLDISRW